MKKKIIYSVAAVFPLTLLGLYVLQMNSLVAVAWKIGDAERSLEELKRQNALLESTATQAISLERLEQLAQSKNFEKVSKVTYVRMPSGPVAQNQSR